MDDFKNKDNLDDFLRNTFEGAEGVPSSDLWGKIESDLDKENGKKPVPVFWWWILAGGLVLALFVSQHFYFENKIQKLEEKFETETAFYKKETKLETQNSLEEIKDSFNIAGTNPRLALTKPEPNENSIRRSQAQNSLALRSTGSEFSGSETGKSDEISKPNFDGSQSEKNSNASENGKFPARIPAENAFDESTELTNADQAPQNEFRKEKVAGDYLKPEFLQQTALTQLPPLPVTLQNPMTVFSFENTQVHANLVSKEPLKAKGTFALGAWVGKANTSVDLEAESLIRPINRAFSIQMRQESGSTYLAGAKLQWRPTQNIVVETGLAYRETQILINHITSINYSERLRNNPAPWPGRDSSLTDFRYALPTSSGTYEVTVRASDNDVIRPLPENEILAFNQQVKELTSYLSMPLSLGVVYPIDRFTFGLKGGVMANLLLKDELSLERLESLNRRFMVSRRLANPTFEPSDLRKLSLDYVVSAEISYQLASSLSFNVEPIIFGTLVDKGKDPRIQTQLTSLGLSGGIYYHF
ncbi:MAG: hypothetical protein R2879_06065 [Saprospiraceae bacterium]